MQDIMSDFADRLLSILLDIHALQDYDNRTKLLRHLPSGPVGFVKRSTATTADLDNIITSAQSWGQLVDSGEWALAIVARNALRLAQGVSQGRELESLLASLEILPSNVKIPPVKEVIIGIDERLPISFLEQGLKASRSVAKVLTPRIFSGKRDGNFAYGTGWLISPGLLITNHHVVAARKEGELPINETDLQSQVAQVVVWFDFQEWDKPYVEYRVDKIIHSNPVLDYALLRLKNCSDSKAEVPISKWNYLSVLQQSTSLNRGDRLNIIQHPQGGPKRLAIRSNFYVDVPSTSVVPHRFHYLTDTEPGSSGSPVLNDNWQVVGLHAAATRVPEAQYKGEIIKYNNQGVLISAVVNDLPLAVRKEIATNQVWE